MRAGLWLARTWDLPSSMRKTARIADIQSTKLIALLGQRANVDEGLGRMDFVTRCCVPRKKRRRNRWFRRRYESLIIKERATRLERPTSSLGKLRETTGLFG